MKTLPKNAYGLLLIFDGYGADAKRCADTGRLYTFLHSLPEAIGMRRLGFPHLVTVEEPGIRGISAFTFIMESHISVHTYSERGFVTVDVYSCKAFDTEEVTSILASYFSTESHTVKVITRGSQFAATHPRQRKRSR